MPHKYDLFLGEIFSQSDRQTDRLTGTIMGLGCSGIITSGRQSEAHSQCRIQCCTNLHRLQLHIRWHLSPRCRKLVNGWG